MYERQKLLVANRGEIAVRIIRAAKELGLPTVAVYTASDTLSPHVSLADEAVALPTAQSLVNDMSSESHAYANGPAILTICEAHSVTLLHPGYGFLSENADFASLVIKAGITWLGPEPKVIRMMGFKHEARLVALRAGVPVVPGSSTLLETLDEALVDAERFGFPLILKATAGGGGMGMVICENEQELRERFITTKARAKTLFGEDGLFIEQYIASARHIEIQVFGNGLGDVVHMGERECSIQRRHQKLIEEAPSPFMSSHLGLKRRMCEAAVQLCRSIKYGSAGTVEFIVDDESAQFYFLEMNTRIQVEHPVTEAIYPGLDLVKLMIYHGLVQRQALGVAIEGDLETPSMQQETYDELRFRGRSLYSHAIEVRVYAENPSEGFLPSPGLLQYVELNPKHFEWLRVESWISTGLSVTPFFDGLLCKLIVTGRSRKEAIARLGQALDASKVCGPPNNLEYLKAVVSSDAFRIGQATTRFLLDFPFNPRAMKILSAGLECTIQDLPGRTIGLGIPRSGPMDSLAFRAGNILVENPATTEGLEIIVVPGMGFEVIFFVPAVIAVTGKEVSVMVNGELVDMWSSVIVPDHGRLRLDVDATTGSNPGLRVYLCIRGGFPNVAHYLGSKSTSMGLGGYQGRSLLPGDQLALGSCGPNDESELPHIPRFLVPKYPLNWIIHVLPGPQGDEEYVTTEGIRSFYSTKWRVGVASNRLGIRLESQEKIQWSRENGGEGGSHPSNILDNGYALGTININGDTPVVLANEGPDMGGYVSLCTIASADMWKLGQLQSGCTVEFRRVSWAQSLLLREISNKWLAAVALLPKRGTEQDSPPPWAIALDNPLQSPILYEAGSGRSRVVFRQAGDSAILVEFGAMKLDFDIRARIHAFEMILNKDSCEGLGTLCPCIRSILCHFNPEQVTQPTFLDKLVDALGSLPSSGVDMTFVGHKLTFPIVLDDLWSRDALNRYMATIRQKAVYLPSNIQYLARNNGLSGGAEEALHKLIGTDWLVLGVGFYLACPFLIPVDPRCRLVGQKMNPSRTYTPRGAIGMAGPVAAIYPVESPGGYQLFGRTLPTWRTWGNGKDFSLMKPWLLQCFDQIHFEPVTSDEYIILERDFDAGRHSFKIEPTSFSMSDYAKFLEYVSADVTEFRRRQEEGCTREAQQEQEYLREWESEKNASLETRVIGNGRKRPSPHKLLPATTQTPQSHEEPVLVHAPLFASVQKIKLGPGDILRSTDDIVLILEAMKTEIPIRGGDNNVGKVIERLGNGIAAGSLVSPGDVLFVLI
ncbi:putative urea carboxylase [Hypsizygus marmoreus]|uniref:Urea carboxylase n=1 Tax=Hypsizygus marmoreus TaxID=39966 RepID=A0A369JHZ2_HYPMA|nr:putative urea carboxylase [Hypsizygus marmoreus]